jgi:hypothetical protein
VGKQDEKGHGENKCQKRHEKPNQVSKRASKPPRGSGKTRGNHKKKVAKPPTAPINRKQARQRKSQGQATNRATITKIGETTKRNWKTPRENRRIPTGATRRREPKRRRQKQRRRRRQNQQPSLLARPPGFPVFPGTIHLFPQATIAGPQRPCNPTSWKVVEGRPDGSRCRSPNTPCFTSQRATATRATTTMTER